jgi:NADPH2:quinone reductase
VRALRFSSFGGPEVLRVEELEAPTPGPGEVLVDVHAGGLNFADTERRRGLYLANEPLPETSGFEAAGVVTALGLGVEHQWKGRRVAFIHHRAHAEQCVVPAHKLIALPDEIDFVHGAAFPVQALTAWHVLHTLGHVTPKDTVLVHSAAGGVGQLLVQLAREAGAQVIGTVSRDAKQPQVLDVGAHHALTRGPDFLTQLKALAPQGVSLLLEGIGAEIRADVLGSLAPLGRWVTYGTASGAPPPLDFEALAEKSITVSSFWLRTALPAEVRAGAEEEVLSRLVTGQLHQNITTCPLDDAPRAHRRLEAGLTTGKWVLLLR